MKKSNSTNSSNACKPMLQDGFLTPYLPYGLKIYACYNEYLLEMEEDPCSDGISVRETIDNLHKPILRPLSDLKNEIEVNGEQLIPIKYLAYSEILEYVSKYPKDYNDLQDLRYCMFLQLLKLHFDVFGLIEKGLAVSINDYNQTIL